MTTTYFIQNKEVTKKEYESLREELEDVKFVSCREMNDGGSTREKATHKKTKEEYSIIETVRSGKSKYEIRKGK